MESAMYPGARIRMEAKLGFEPELSSRRSNG